MGGMGVAITSGSRQIPFIDIQALGAPGTQEQQIVQAFGGVLGQGFSQDGAGHSANMHFLSHRRSPWVIALTRDPRIIESAGHFCEPHIHRLAQSGGAGVFWDSIDATASHIVNHETACGRGHDGRHSGWVGCEEGVGVICD